MLNTVEQINLTHVGTRAKAAARELVRATTEQKNRALLAIADALIANEAAILAENALDLEDGVANGLSPALLDRMSLQKRLPSIAADVRQVATLPDPVGHEFDVRTLDNGLRVSRRRTPIGVIGVIYEARPNVTVDVAALTLKSANAVIMRGGKEIMRSNMALLKVLREAMVSEGLPADAMQYIESTDRQYITELLKLHEYVDVIIPRGGAALHKLCRENSTIPVITGGIGICHVFVDETADLDAALPIIDNARTQRPSVCNSLDTVLVHAKVATQILPRIVEHLAPKGVTFRAEPRAKAILDSAALNGSRETIQDAGDEDFDTEWMALILGLKVVDSLDEAIDHIQQHSMNHTDSILTRDMDNAARFFNEVDSSAVMLNASTRFNDGGQLGLGAEVAVSTQKLHARGPMALEELTTYKWVVIGTGHIRA
jgi:glutamate-5-semialdehyde dehydrogenase